MNKEQALDKLDLVISKSRVEMYKPIQVAEVLHAANRDLSIDLSDLETYRTRSKQLRDNVTKELFGKVSTSSAKFQDDIWAETAVPPTAMEVLGNLNSESGLVEEYIYQSVWAKNSFLIKIRESIHSINNIDDIRKLFEAFNSDGMRSSEDRLFEIFCVAVLQSDATTSEAYVKVMESLNSNSESSVERIIENLLGKDKPLQFSRIGHTNAADAGIDIWSNFGVIVSVKNYLLDGSLAKKVIEDTPVGELVIACDSYSEEGINEIKSNSQNRSITVVTKSDLMKDAERLLLNLKAAEEFLRVFLSNYDHEFPRTTTLEDFMNKRGYTITTPLRANI